MKNVTWQFVVQNVAFRPKTRNKRVRSGSGESGAAPDAGSAPGDVLFYSHLDKQPPVTELWSEGKHPFEPVREDPYLFGRGSVDDGYGGYLCALAVKSLQEMGLPHPRCRFLIETCEESGSYDLPAYLDAHQDEIGSPLLNHAAGTQQMVRHSLSSRIANLADTLLIGRYWRSRQSRQIPGPRHFHFESGSSRIVDYERWLETPRHSPRKRRFP